MEIYGTLGPRCSEIDTLAEMFEAGMTGVRLNLSHVTLRDAEEQIEHLHRAAARAGVQARLLIDMQGPELRIGALKEPMTLTAGSEVYLGEGGVPVPMIALPALRPGQEVLLDDGKILLSVRESGKERHDTGRAERPESHGVCTDSGKGSRVPGHRTGYVKAEVLRGGMLTGRKSLALPGVTLHPPAMTETDLENIRQAGEYGVTAVMQPFVRSREDLRQVREALNRAGGEKIRLLAKIENREGLEHLEELIPACDEIVIARGDLGNAMPLWELPRVQKRIAGICRESQKPFMVVTQMLASMEHSAVPTRAEVSDIFNAVCDGASSVMVTGETAVGEYPVEVIRYLSNTVREALAYLE